MARVYFTRDFDYFVHRHQFIAYRAGESYTVKRDCADKAIAAGAAVEEKPPPRRKKAAAE